MGWVDPSVGLSWIGLGWVEIFSFLVGWVGSWPCGSETFTKILKLGRPLVTAEVIPDNLIMVSNT